MSISRRAVLIVGTAPNLQDLPLQRLQQIAPSSVELWACNDPKPIYRLNTPILQHYTRWFNLHSIGHMLATYPRGVEWYQAQSKPLYTQRPYPEIPTSQSFPREVIQAFFSIDGKPNRYFTCSVCWLIALAIYEGFTDIELWGFQLSDRKPGQRHAYERPCFFYWVEQARQRGIEVWYPPEVAKIPYEPGDPRSYTGPLYGYGTKPEADWSE